MLRRKSVTDYGSTSTRQIACGAALLLEDGFFEAVSLDRLASAAAMSKYHFAPTFWRVIETAPYQYLLALRMRHVAIRLASSGAPISEIAFDAGCGDLSTLISRFRRQFAESPSSHRARYRSASQSRGSAIE